MLYYLFHGSKVSVLKIRVQRGVLINSDTLSGYVVTHNLPIAHKADKLAHLEQSNWYKWVYLWIKMLPSMS